MGTPHRVMTTEVFYFDQLSDSAKEKARDWWRQLEAQDPSWHKENKESLDEFCKWFPINARSWEYDQVSGSIIWSMRGGEESHDLTGVRLVAYIQNHYARILYTPKVYEKGGKQRRSRILMEQSACPFTGYCMDESLLDPIREFLRKPDMTINWKQLLGSCLEAWVTDCSEDAAYSMGDENVGQNIISNEYEFDEGGNKV